MPLASMSKVTSICGTPRGAGGMPASWKRPSVRLSAAIGRSPCSTWISTAVWLSAAVEKISLFCVGMVVLRSMSFGHDTAQRLDAQRQRGDVEQEDVLHVAGQHAALNGRADGDDFVRVDALVRLLAEDSLHQLLDDAACASIRRRARTSSMSLGCQLRVRRAPASPARPCARRGRRSSCSNFARVSVRSRCFGPDASAVMNGRLMSVSHARSTARILAFSAASFRRCSAIRSLRRSMPSSLLELLRPSSR